MKNKLIALLLIHQVDFMYTVTRRQSTSTGNKELHQAVLDALEDRDYNALYKAIFDKWYLFKPLSGVIYTMDIEHEEKMEIIDVYNAVIDEF